MDVVRFVESLGLGGMYVERRKHIYMLRLANNEVTVAKHWHAVEYGIRLVKGKRHMFVTSTDEEGLKSQVEAAARGMETVPETVEIDPPPAPRIQPPAWAYDPRVLDVERAVERISSAVSGALNRGADRCAGAATFGEVSVRYVDTWGREAEYRVTTATFTIRAFRGEASATRVSVSRSMDMWGPEDAAVSAADLAVEAAGLPEEKLEPGTYDVALDPMVVTDLLGYAAHYWFNGHAVISGTSRFGMGDIGKAVASPALTIRDSASMEGSLGYVPFDFEAVEARDLDVVAKGTLSGFAHNLATARMLGAEPTGNAIGFEGWVVPMFRQVYVEPGDVSGPEEVGNGIYITNNWYTRFQNVREGLFSTVARDAVLVVRGGRPVARTRGVRISDSLASLLANVWGTGKRLVQVYWWETPTPGWAPLVLVRGINVTRA